MVSLLERLGVAVDFPLDQTCCGQMHFNTGYADETVPLVRRFVRAFADSEVVVSPSASCVGMVRDYYPRVAELSGDPALQRQVQELRPRVVELAELAEAARVHLRRLFLDARVGISGVNFAVAETGTVSVVESEGNGRMCTTLPEVLISVMGIEKVVPRWQDLEVFLQLLPRSSTAERMNPYTSLWTGVTEGDGPREFHLVLLDNGRTNVLADQIGRQALNCIRCSACLNVCPVYERTGGHAYGSTYPDRRDLHLGLRVTLAICIGLTVTIGLPSAVLERERPTRGGA